MSRLARLLLGPTRSFQRARSRQHKLNVCSVLAERLSVCIDSLTMFVVFIFDAPICMYVCMLSIVMTCINNHTDYGEGNGHGTLRRDRQCDWARGHCHVSPRKSSLSFLGSLVLNSAPQR
jgi:hypothetical protein